MKFNGYRKGRFTRENASRLGKLGVAARARKRLESPPDDEPRRVPEGEFLGVLRWYAADGTVRQWVITQGDRANNIAVASFGKRIVCGWDWLFRSLRKKLAIPKRVFTTPLSSRDALADPTVIRPPC
jgi:hypothetical protein